MPPSPEQSNAAAIESKETAHEQPNLTVYLMRHGESESDKTIKNRGLTEQGREEVTVNFNEIINQIVKDELPDFDAIDDPEERKQAVQKALQNVELHLTDSGTDRTSEQAWQERQMLIDLGADPEDIILPRSTYEWAVKQGHVKTMPENAGPGVPRRLEGVRGMQGKPEFRKKIDSKEYQKEVGAEDTLIAWALTDKDQIPKGVENKNQMEERLGKDLSIVNRAARILNNYDKRIVYIANSHASIITLAASSKLDVPMKELGEVPNAEGVRFDFYGPGTDYTTKPFGKNLTAKVESLKK